MNQRRRLEQLAIASLTEADCPDVEQLAAYALGMLGEAEQLRVAAHVRACPICTREIALCRPPTPRRRALLASPIPFPMSLATLRGAPNERIRRYAAADLLVDITIAPPEGDFWRVTGQVTRDAAGVDACDIVMRAGRRRYTQVSDPQGFFTFEGLPAGRYTLTVDDSRVQVRMRDIVLALDDS
jgi:anti-sigma factor RsiW